MVDHETCDISLFGLWPRSPRYDGDLAGRRVETAYHVIEPKARSGDADDALRLLLNDLTAEMRAQFAFFRKLRMAAVKKSRAEDGDATDVRGEVKAAADAVALIIRTLEKADELQRRLAENRRNAEERDLNLRDYDDAKAHFLDLIEKRAEELAQKRIAERATTGTE
ncbi:hypothetical protein [uncultured Martelella sp.]|uniref:hypothetical protein n=1 Tax=uncultured Martelella sp. TaxID=392331 RepID=UPI0029C9380D|nr:hypothetical protein [uncultured Martelella sp.]